MAAPPVAAVLLPTEKALTSDSTLSQLGFPNEFPYEFDSPTFSSAFASSEDSTETEDETSDDEDDFLAGLTRRLALSTQRLPSPPPYFVADKAEMKPQITAKTPESTLSGLGNPNGPFSQVPSPPTSPFREEDSWKVISAAAGEVAKMKMTNFDAEPKSRHNPNPSSFIPNAAFSGYWVCQPQNSHYGLCLQPALIASPYPVRGVLAAPNAVKQQSTGTGVFLPRSYSNPTDSRKKSGGGGVRVPTKVVHQQNPKTEQSSGRHQPHSQACLSNKGRSKINYVAGGGLKKERSLPQEWIY